MNAIAALAYADVRGFINATVDIRRKPGRLILWLAFFIGIGFNLWARSVSHHHTWGNTPDIVIADYLFCGVLASIGIFLVLGSRAVLFQHPAEARIAVRAPISPATIIGYFHARSSLLRVVGGSITIAYSLLTVLPHDVDVRVVTLDLLMLVTMLLFCDIAMLPRQYAPMPIQRCYKGIGLTAIVLALACLGRNHLDVLFPSAIAATFDAHLPPLHLGVVVLAPGFSICLLLVCALGAAISVRVFTSSTRDIFPELYASSSLPIAAVTRIDAGKRRMAQMPTSPTLPPRRILPVTSDARVPGGAWALLWKSWLPYRSNATPSRIFTECAALATLGYAIGRFSLAMPAVSIIAFLTIGMILLTIMGFLGSQALAAELRRPLFYLSTPTLFERLMMLAISATWRASLWGITVAAVAIASGLGLREGIALMVISPCMFLLSNAAGYALYSLFPHVVDQTGPVRSLRMFLLYILLTPVISVLVVGTLFLHLVPLALGVGSVTALAEAAFLIAIASWRLDARTDILRTV